MLCRLLRSWGALVQCCGKHELSTPWRHMSGQRRGSARCTDIPHHHAGMCLPSRLSGKALPDCSICVICPLLGRLLSFVHVPAIQPCCDLWQGLITPSPSALSVCLSICLPACLLARSSRRQRPSGSTRTHATSPPQGASQPTVSLTASCMQKLAQRKAQCRYASMFTVCCPLPARLHRCCTRHDGAPSRRPGTPDCST